MSNLTFQYFVSPYEVYELVFTDPVVTSTTQMYPSYFINQKTVLKVATSDCRATTTIARAGGEREE